MIKLFIYDFFEIAAVCLNSSAVNKIDLFIFLVII